LRLALQGFLLNTKINFQSRINGFHSNFQAGSNCHIWPGQYSGLNYAPVISRRFSKESEVLPKMRNFLQVVLMTAVVISSAAQAETAMISAPSSTAVRLDASTTSRVNLTSETDSSNNATVSPPTTSAQTSNPAISTSTFSVVPEVGIWSLLAALAGLVLMRIWLSNKRKLSTIR
jgi:hypothetical protein